MKIVRKNKKRAGKTMKSIKKRAKRVGKTMKVEGTITIGKYTLTKR